MKYADWFQPLPPARAVHPCANARDAAPWEADRGHYPASDDGG